MMAGELILGLFAPLAGRKAPKIEKSPPPKAVVFCLGDRESRFGQFSRVVQYRLDTQAAQAVFVRDYALNGTYREFTGSQGSVQKQRNGNWFVSWGNGPAMSVTEVTASGVEIFAAKLTYAGSITVSYRALRDDTLKLDPP